MLFLTSIVKERVDCCGVRGSCYVVLIYDLKGFHLCNQCFQILSCNGKDAIVCFSDTSCRKLAIAAHTGILIAASSCCL